MTAPPSYTRFYAPDGKAEQPLRHLQAFVGIPHVDGCSGDRALAERNAVGLAFCRAHVRHRFDELARSGPAPSATEALALNRRHALFAGSDGGGEPWATIASLIETCKLNGVDPYAYLAGVIARIVAGHPQTKLDDLLPRAYAPEPLKAAA